MKSLDLKSFYAQSLGISSPWKVTDVIFDGEHRVVTVFVECASGVAWADPETGERAEIKDWQERTWRHLDTCQFQTIVMARVPRLLLKNGKSITASVPWAQRGARVTRALESHAIGALLNCRTVRAASRLTGLGEDQLDGIMARAVRDGLARRATPAPTLMGIDEPERSGDRLPQAARRVSAANHKAVRKGHCYASLLIDLNGGGVIDMVEGRTTEAATALLEVLPPSSRTGVKAVAMDMSSAYVSAAQAVLPGAVIVFDAFHVASHLNKAVDTVRRQEHARLRRSGDDTLKGTKYQWLRTYADLRRQEAQDFRRLLRQDLRTAGAWALKENFRRIWSYRSVAGAMRFAHDWAEAVAHAGLRPMIRAAETVKRHLWGIVSFVEHPITNAATEGVNSMIQSLRHSARGLPNFASLRTRVLFHLGRLQLTPS
jgi:transposase